MDNANVDIFDRFRKLGFEEGEWEMFVEEFPNYDPDKLVQQYLEISRKEPYNKDWNDEQDILDVDDDSKNKIANDVLNLYYHPQINRNNEIGGKRKRNNKSRKSRKFTRNNKRKY